MADDDEIDILGDFTFNSCFAQNSQGIPSCSDREDTVHPQWLLDSTATNWYDSRNKEGPLRKLSGTRALGTKTQTGTTWTKAECDLLAIEKNKYGRNIQKISQTLKSKSEAEIQAMIEAEFGVHLENPAAEMIKEDIHDNVPSVEHEEIVSDDAPLENPSALIQTGSPTVKLPHRKAFRKNNNTKSKKSLLKPHLFSNNELTSNSPVEILYEDDLVIGSTEAVGSENDAMDVIPNRTVKAKDRAKACRKLGNHRRKVSRSDKGKNNSKDNLRSSQSRQRKNSNPSESDSTKSPKLQIVLGSGQSLPVAEGEQVIKLENKDSDSEIDIDIDTNSDVESECRKKDATLDMNATVSTYTAPEEPVAVPLRKFEPMPKRHKKFNLDGGGGYTIMHTSAGDLLARGCEPRRARRPPVLLIPCRAYSPHRPAPCEVWLHVSTLLAMEAHAHSSSREVMGLLGGQVAARGPPVLTLAVYRPAAAAASRTHCDMDPVAQLRAAQGVAAAGAALLGWHHSHPAAAAAPSAQDVRSQAALQAALDRPRAPFLALVSAGRGPAAVRCLRAEPDRPAPAPYELRLRLRRDVAAARLPALLAELRRLLAPTPAGAARLLRVCPYARLTYLDKYISTVTQHMRAAGYSDSDAVFQQLIQGIRDVGR